MSDRTIESPPLAMLRAQDSTLLTLSTTGSAALVDVAHGKSQALAGGPYHHGCLFEGGALVISASQLLCFARDGNERWRVDLEAGNVGRVFLGAKADAVVLLHRRRRFLFERYALGSGEYQETRVIERRRAIVVGGRVWARDARGVSSFFLYGTQVERCPLKDNGPMEARGGSVYTLVGPRSVTRVMGGERRWFTTVKGRDLRKLSIRDGLEADEDEFEPARLGRPRLFGGRLLVPDANGSLHALNVDDGSIAWRFDGQHYPTLSKPPRPAIVGETIGYVGADEYLYAIDGAGGCTAFIELPDAPDVPPVAADGRLVVAARGLHLYDLRAL
ncbi:MAG: PQQ-binding-like beta-propeller repeat protein [Myxococcota bacterium]